MKEFENLVHRTHRTGLKVIIDFVPNHVAREYHSDAQPDEDLPNRELTMTLANSFSPYNNFYYIPQAELHAQLILKTVQQYANGIFGEATGNNRFEVTSMQYHRLV